MARWNLQNFHVVGKHELKGKCWQYAISRTRTKAIMRLKIKKKKKNGGGTLERSNDKTCDTSKRHKSDGRKNSWAKMKGQVCDGLRPSLQILFRLIH